MKRAGQQGWSTTEYLAILTGLVVLWRSSQLVLEHLAEHHDEFSWALMIPF
ncbi:MAG TPA: hypothetical protein VGE08_20305 [Steroidobacter sp.]|uniref:hypothetical protein n=1 Tax=Steroidobacter sp. TaxID=1978227 RepID=UPI002EDAB5F5